MRSPFKLKIQYVSYIPTGLLDMTKDAIKHGLLAEEFMDEEHASVAAKKYEDLANSFREYGYHKAAEISAEEFEYWCDKSFELYSSLDDNLKWRAQLEGLGMEIQ